MVDTLIQANDCLLQIKIGDTYKDVLCAKSFTVTVNTDEKETTTSGDGVYKAYDYKALSYTVNFNGVMKMPDSNPTNFDFVDYQKAFEKPFFRVAWIDPLGAIKTFSGSGVVKTNNLVTSSAQLGDATVDIIGDGEYFIGNTIDEFIDINLIVTGNDSAPAFFKFWLLDSDGNIIFMTDTMQQASGGVLGNPLNITVQVPPGSYYIYYYVDTNTVGNTISVSAPPTYSSAFPNGVTQFNSYPNQQYDFTANRTVTVTLGTLLTPPTCVAPGFLTGLNNPTAVEGTPWTGTVTLSGSQPFNIDNVTKPSWMSISISGNTVTCTGNPQAGLAQPISFRVNNACGNATYNDQIDVSANPNAIALQWTYTESGTFALASVMRLFVNAVQVASHQTTGSGSTVINPGDFVEVQVSGVSGSVSKHIQVVGTVAGTIINDTSTSANMSRSFTAVLGNNYTITTSAIG